MAGRFVRSSKYRHVFGRSTKKEQCYDNLRISKNAWDTNLVKANPEYISVNWEASGGGAFAVIPIDERGKLPEHLPLFRGHTAAVLDTDWNPFNDSIIASGSDDCKVFIWKVPENFTLHSDAEEPEDVSPVSRFTGHSRKVGHVLFNPSAANVLASSSGDYTVKIWDIEAGQSKLNLKHPDIVQSLSWSANGALLVTTGRDKKLRIWDTRQERPAQENPGHSGAKNSRAVWMGEHDRIATTGFSRMSDRQLGLWDVKNPKEPIGGFQILDQISGVCMPFWDDGTNCLFLAGKGDGNIRYYEYENDKFEYLSEYKSADPQRGVAFLPKRGVNLHENEVMRAFKTVADAYVEPISFIVPRRAEVFQNDIFPPAVGIKPGMSSSEYFDGKEALPPKIDLESIYSGGAPKEVPADYKPPKQEVPAQAPAPVKAEAPKSVAKAPEPEPVQRDTSKGIQDNKASMAAMADRFADKEPQKEDTSDDESFEEIPKPVERPSVMAARGPPPKMDPSPRTPTLPSEPATKSAAADPPTSTPTPAPAPAAATSAVTSSPQKLATATGAAEGLKAHLQDIKESQARLMAMLEAQNRTMASQSDQINGLTEEVEHLKAKVGGSAGGGRDERDEKIRRLELELEEYRS